MMKKSIGGSMALAAIVCVALVIGCDGTLHVGVIAAEPHEGPAYVDSLRTVEEDLAKFRESLGEPVEHLAGGAASKDELIAEFLSALEQGDRDRLAELTITPVEFAYLYYPFTRFTEGPYELSPGLLWFQLQNYGSRGLDRALRRFGSKPANAVGHVCPGDAEVEGSNRVWNGCLVRITEETDDTVEVSLFGAILEREGRFKFVSYANRL